MAKTVADVIKMMKENEVKFVDFRFTDTRGKEQHVTVPVSHFDEDKFTSGHAFDGSSIAGWKGIEASDMLLMPDPNTANIDPFFEETTMFLSCDVVEPGDGKAYDRDPRSIAKRAEAYLKSSGMGDTAFFGPEPEFFIFDDVRWGADMSGSFVKIDEYEAPWNTGKKLEGGNKGHRPTVKGGYFPVPPVDSTQDLRAEISLILESLGIPVEVFHHEVAGAGQNEIGTKFSTLVQRADWTQMPTPTARRPPSCPSPWLATTAPACTCTSPSGRMARTCLPVTVMPACPTSRCTTSAASSSMPAR
jgi:glutamine synthetase